MELVHPRVQADHLRNGDFIGHARAVGIGGEVQCPCLLHGNAVGSRIGGIDQLDLLVDRLSGIEQHDHADA